MDNADRQRWYDEGRGDALDERTPRPPLDFEARQAYESGYRSADCAACDGNGCNNEGCLYDDREV